MSSPNSESSELFRLAIETKKSDEIPGEKTRTNASTRGRRSIFYGVPIKDSSFCFKGKNVLKDDCVKSRLPSLPKVRVALTDEEIDEDLLILTGKRPLRGKTRRSKQVKKDLEVILPGASLDGHDANTLLKSYGTFSGKQN